MSDEQLEHLQKLLRIKQRRLNALEEQAARDGRHTPPEIVTEIEDIRLELQRLLEQEATIKAADQPRGEPASLLAPDEALPKLSKSSHRSQPSPRRKGSNFAEARAFIRKAEVAIETGNIPEAFKALKAALREPKLHEAKRLIAGLIENHDITIEQRITAARLAANYDDIRPGVCTLAPKWCGPFQEGYYQIRTQTKLFIPQPIWLNEFSIACYPITIGQFRIFKEGHGYQKAEWWTTAGWDWLKAVDEHGKMERITQPYGWGRKGWNAPNQPVFGVSWYEAMAFCKWLTEQGRSHTPPWLAPEEIIRLS